MIVSLRDTGILNAILNCVDLAEQERNCVEPELGGLDTGTNHKRRKRLLTCEFMIKNSSATRHTDRTSACSCYRMFG
jgi:hypothetical protein